MKLFGKRTDLDDQIDKVMSELDTMSPIENKYPEMLGYLERLIRLKNEERRDRISKDAILGVAGSLLGILIIVAFEQNHVIGSKGLGFIPRPR